ncbi:diaminopimelate epimerase [Natronoarchaeum philippinense]|uniref:Diaminopimelate epimerase n=1 Tax=Natronoarchaeum philippinense TaxID=558529 RepID=A0A285NYC1_NATPI|nr:diaminopimelate epimerase [Natronoarchaeum philippinense]SNZ12886.1 diaminopimelate epimerase [Natronoarchaeum philippinense]
MIPFEKYNGTDNDFVVIEAADATTIPNLSEFAVEHCDRSDGLGADREGATTGADGVLVLDVDADAEPVRVEMTLYQPDGGTAAMCGNGARVVAAWAHERTGETDFVIETGAGDRAATVEKAESGEFVVSVEMGEPAFSPGDVPLAESYDEPIIEEDIGELTVTAVNTGVPHAVAFVEDVDAVELDAVAPATRHADAFPEGANVNLAAVDGDGFRQRTFERGVEGETKACGTGAVAIAAVARRLGHTDEDAIRVSPPGGDLDIRVPDEGPAILRGPVAFEYADRVDPLGDALGGGF